MSNLIIPEINGISAGTSSVGYGNVVFSNSNNVSFGLNGSIVTASASVAAGAGDGFNILAAGSQTANTTGTISFADSNGITFGMSNSSIITASHNGLTSQSNQAVSAANGSFAFQTLSLADSNGVSFSTGTQGIFATVKTDYLTTQSGQAFSALGGSSAFQTLSFSNANGISFSNNAGQVQASYTVPSVPAQSQQPAILSISGGTTRITNNEAVFSNANGITFGVDGQTVTASHNGLTSQSNQAASAANGSFAFQTVLFSNANGISFGTSAGSAITGSHNALTSQSNQAFSAQGGSSAFQTLIFTNSNGFSFSNTGGSVWGSYTVPTVTNSSWTVSDAASSASVARLAFTNMNGVTLSLSTGANGSHTIVGSHNALTSQSNQALSGSNGSFTFQTATLGNLNGLSFYTSNGSVVGSYTVPAAQTNQTVGFYALSNTTGQSSSSTFDARTLSFHGAGIASVGASGGSIVISVPAGGGAGDGVNILAAGTQTANTTGTVVFSNSNHITFGMSNSSVITASFAENTTNYWGPYDHRPASAQSMGNATLNFRHATLPWHVTFDRVVDVISYTNASNSTGTVSLSFSHGIYTKTGSTLSLISSTSTSISIHATGTASASINNGIRLLTTPWSMSLSSGIYYLGLWSRTSTSSQNVTLSNVMVQAVLAQVSGLMLVASNTSVGMYNGQGHYSVSVSTAMPSSVGISAINAGQFAFAHYMPLHYYSSDTV